MALDARKRQKKLERKQAKHRARKKSMVRCESDSMLFQIERSTRAPWLHCRAMNALWDKGIGQVLISRQLPSRQVILSSFLVDMYCLGVKDAFVAVLPNSKYQERIVDRMATSMGGTVDMTPEAVCKLVQGAIAYARDLGFSPHPDCILAHRMLAGIDPGKCDEEFEYGKNGKPLFISGPHDAPERCRRIIATLNESCGPGGFHYVVHAGSPYALGSFASLRSEDEGEYLEFADDSDE